MKKTENQFRYAPDTYGTVRALGIDKYPGEMAIVRELVQNADDAIDKKKNIFPTYIKFTIKSDSLIVEHDGKPFSKPPKHLLQKIENEEILSENESRQVFSSDFKKISTIGLGKTDEELTGKFGTGFTSVFHITDSPRIRSNGWDFEIQIDKNPSIKEIPNSRLTYIYLPFRTKKTEVSLKIGAELFDENKKNNFKEQILSESYNIIFFLNHIKKIELFEDDIRFFSIEKIERQKKTKVKSLLCNDVVISIKKFQDNKENKERWWIYRLDNIPIPGKFEYLDLKLKQTVSIAICKEKSRHEKINYSYFTLPIMKTGFHFKYNALKFFVTSSRDDFNIKEGLKNDWNKWQLENLVALLVKIVKEFVLSGREPETLYRFLPHPHEYCHEYDKYLFDKFKRKILEGKIKIFYTTGGKWVSSRNNVYCGDARLEHVLPKSEFPYFIERKCATSFKRILETFGAEFLSYNDLIKFLDDNHKTESFERRFKTKSNPNKIKKLRLIYEFLEDYNHSMTDHERSRLKKTNFILTEAGTLRSAKYPIFFITDEKMPLIDPDDIINHLVYTSKKSKSFLRSTLNIEKINLHKLIVGSFLLRLDHYTEKQKLSFVKFLIGTAKGVLKNNETCRELKKKRKEFLSLISNNQEDKEIYFYSEEIYQIFGGKLNYLSQNYEKILEENDPKWKDFFKSLGVKELPRAEKIIEVAKELSEKGFSNKNAAKAEKLFKFTSKYLKNFIKTDIEKLKELKNFKWVPSTNKNFESPENLYVDRKISVLVGNNVPFVSFFVRRNDALVNLFKIRKTPKVKDVVDHLLNHAKENNKIKDKRVNFKIYDYLDKNIKNIERKDLIDDLKSNRTIWLNGKLWYPKKVYLKNLFREFGPNGKIRGYLHKSNLKELKDICSLLEIKEEAVVPDDYIAFLLDISSFAERISISKWRTYIENAHEKIAVHEYPLTNEQTESLAESKIIIYNSTLIPPSGSYLILETDKIFKERIERSGIIDVPFIVENDPRKEKFYLSIDMNEIYEFMFQKRADENKSDSDRAWKEKLEKLIPWINGYLYRKFGPEGLLNLAEMKKIDVQRISGLNVIYGINHNGKNISGNPIEDFCCLEINEDDGSIVLYLDKSFDEKNDKHTFFLSSLLTNLIKSVHEKERINWILLMCQYFQHGMISGINPYYPKQEEKRKNEFKEDLTEENEEGSEDGGYDGDFENDADEIDPSEETQTPEKDDGLTIPTKTTGQKKSKKRKSLAPRYRAGGYVTPHAIDYEGERNWVRTQSNDFCQSCVLFCANCNVRGGDEICTCETRKNAERALFHHHLEPFEGDLKKDVRGNLIVVCSYHHKQLDGINFKSGYLKEKLDIDEKEDCFIVKLYPKDKDEKELSIKFSKDHFNEVIKYNEK